jgi:hypothetical protein
VIVISRPAGPDLTADQLGQQPLQLLSTDRPGKFAHAGSLRLRLARNLDPLKHSIWSPTFTSL